MLLNNKVALVTGAGQGIGEAVAKCYAKEGAKVVVVDINEETAKNVVLDIKNTGGDAVAFQADVTKWEEVKAMVKFAVDTYGKLDVACNNAGKSSATINLVDTPVENFNEVIDLDVLFLREIK